MIKIQEIKQENLVVLKCKGSQNLTPAFEQLVGWIESRNLMKQDSRLLTIYHDSFRDTPESEVRMSAGFILASDERVEEPFEKIILPEMKCIVGSFSIQIHEFPQKWSGLFQWMNQNGYKRAVHDPFEIYYNDFNAHPQKLALVDFCIPVE